MIVSLYYFEDSIKITDSLVWLSVIYAIQGMPFSVFMMAGFVRGIHNALLEAATIDGASQFTIFFKIIFCTQIPFIPGLPAIYSRHYFTLPQLRKGITIAGIYGSIRLSCDPFFSSRRHNVYYVVKPVVIL